MINQFIAYSIEEGKQAITHGNLKENIDFDIRRSAKGCKLHYLFTLFVKEYNRPIF